MTSSQNPDHIEQTPQNGHDMIEIRQLPRLTRADLQALPQLEGEEDPLHTDGVLDLASLFDIIIDVRRAEILLFLDNRTADNFYVGNACLLVGRDFNNLDYPYPHAQGPLGEPINSHWTIPYRSNLLFIANMGVLQQWDFSFSATHIDFFAVEVPGLVDPLPSYGDPEDEVSEAFIEANMPRWTSKVNILGVSSRRHDEST